MVKDLGSKLLNRHQCSDGDLDRSDEGNSSQNSPGDLKCPSENNSPAISETIQKLSPEEIQPFSLIPDYRTPTTSKYPLVVKTLQSCHCIEGWHLVEEARYKEEAKIHCHVSYLEEFSETELAIRKVAIRTLPQGGKASYAEKVRNFKKLFRHLMTTLENPVLYSHGGTRRGPNYGSNQEDDVRSLMETRTGVSRNTISKYLSYAEYLNDEAMGILVASGAERDFFEEAQKNKRILTKNLRQAEKPEGDMTIKISTAMLNWLEEYRETGGIKSILHETENRADGADSESSTKKYRCILRSRGRFDHWTESNDSSEAAEPTTETVRDQFTEIAQRMVEFATASEFTVREALQLIKAILIDLTQLHAKILHLSQEQNHENKGELS